MDDDAMHDATDDERDDATRDDAQHDSASDDSTEEVARDAARAPMLDDGSYDVFIVWAEEREGAIALDLTVVSGPHKGEVLTVLAREFTQRDPIDLVGLPCTLHVEGGRPRVTP